MSFRPPEHELHHRRLGRNLGLGAALLAFVILVFGMTIEKVKDGAPASAMLGQTPSSASAVKPAGGGIAVKVVSSSETGTTSGGGN